MKASSSDRYRSLDTNGAGSPRGRASGRELPRGGQVEPPACRCRPRHRRRPWTRRAQARGGHRAEHNADLRARPFGELVQQLAKETSTLVRQEIELAKAEVSEKGQAKRAGQGMFGAAGIVALLALGALTAAAILALDLAVARLARRAHRRGRLRRDGRPTCVGRQGKGAGGDTARTADRRNVKEDVEWAKTRARSATK